MDVPFVVITAMDGNLYIYEWNSSTGFHQKQSLQVEDAEIKFLHTIGNSYLIVYENSLNPKMYKWMGTQFSSSDDFNLPKDNQYFASQFSSNSKEYFVFKNYGDYTEDETYSYGLYQFDNHQFSEKYVEKLTSRVEIASFEINIKDYLLKIHLDHIEIYKCYGGSQKLYDTINCDSEYLDANMFLMNNNQYIAAYYSDEYDPDNPTKELRAGIFVYQLENENNVNLEDAICAMQILSGLSCDYQGTDIDSDGITGIEEVLYNLNVLKSEPQ